MAFEDSSPSLIMPITDMMGQFCLCKQNVKCFLFCDIFDWIQQNHAIWRVEIIIHHKFQILQTLGRNIPQGKRKSIRARKTETNSRKCEIMKCPSSSSTLHRKENILTKSILGVSCWKNKINKISPH